VPSPAALELREVVQRTGLTPDTLRYYEREGLVGPIARMSGQRRYSEDDVAWIGIVTCLRDAGLGIADLRRFTTLLRDEAGAGDRVEFLLRRRAELQERLAQITAAVAVLDDKIAYYAAP
jgi:DNA-binding transcriptional MerR regulator